MLIVDDHLAVLAVAGRLPELVADGPVATTWGFQFRMARAIADSATHGSLSRRAADPQTAVRRLLRPPADRLVVLDPRASIAHTVQMAIAHRANLLLAELLGAAIHRQAAIRVTPANVGKHWRATMEAEGIDFATVVA